MKRLFFISILLIHSTSINAQVQDFIELEEIVYNEHIRFPRAIGKNLKMEKVANLINKQLSSIIFYNEKDISGNNLELVEEHLFIQNDSINQPGISSLDYRAQLYPRFLLITIDIDWAGGPYPISGKTDYLHFDLETGEYIMFPDLISGARYFDFLDKFWLKDCNTSIRESHQCAHGNQTDDYESAEAYTLDGECEFQCHKVNHEFILSPDSIFLKNNANCFPHVWRNCNYGASKYLKLNRLQEYLSDYGKWLLGIQNNFSAREENFHFVGKVGGKYKISMTLILKSEGEIIGHYFYWSQQKPIALQGKFSENFQHVILSEMVDDTITGRFQLDWDVHSLYSTNGNWSNPEGNKKLQIELLNIYDFKDRNYHR